MFQVGIKLLTHHAGKKFANLLSNEHCLNILKKSIIKFVEEIILSVNTIRGMTLPKITIFILNSLSGNIYRLIFIYKRRAPTT